MNNQIDWDRFTGQWLTTVRVLRRDPNYCRLARAMALADGQLHDWPYYLSLAKTWKGIHDDRDHASMQAHCEALRAKGWAISVKDGRWVAEVPGLEAIRPRLADLLIWIERTGQTLIEQWAAHSAAFERLKAEGRV